MILLVTFATIFVIGQVLNVLLAIAVERFSDSAGLASFFILFAVVVIAGWQIAVRLVDRIMGPAQDDGTPERASRSH